MTSKLVVNTIEADTGISSVSFASSISLSSTSVFHFGDAGLNIGADTNINRPAAGVIGFNVNGAEKVRIDSSGHMHGVGVVTATHFYGDGSNLTGIDATSIKHTDGNVKVQANAVGAVVTGILTATGIIETTGGHLKITGAEPRLTFTDTDNNPDFQIWANAQKFSIYDSTNSATRINIDSSGHVAINTTTEGHGNADDFTISYNNQGVSGGDQGRCGMTIRSGDNTSGVTQNGYIYFSDGTSGGNEYRGVVAYRHSDDSMYFSTSGTERLCIPSTGGIELKTDGKGIQFPIPQTPHNANTARTGISSEMRYYETGTMTPGLSSTVLNSLQNPVFTDASYARRVCRYVRVGY